MKDKRIHRNIFINAALLVFGVVIFAAAGFVKEGPIEFFLGGLGGAVLGAAITGILLFLRGLDLIELALESIYLIKRNIGQDDALLTDKFRKKYYHYHATIIEGKRIWILAIFDFSREFISRGLKCHTSFSAGERHPMEYDLIGTILGRALITSDSIDIGVRCTHMNVFPFFAEPYTDVAHGFLFHENWDAQPQVSPCFITLHPINGVDKPGRVPTEAALALDSRWLHAVSAGSPLNLNLDDLGRFATLIRHSATLVEMPTSTPIHSQEE